MTADDHVASEGRESRDGALADFRNIHPSAGGELEILRDAAVEGEAFRLVVRVEEAERIAEPVIALLVEGLMRRLGLAP